MSVVYNQIKYQRSPTQFPGDYRIKKLSLTNSKGKEVELFDQMFQLDIFESIGSYLTGAIVIIDTTNIIGQFPIIGEETINIKIEEETGDKVDLKFRIYKISGRKQVNIGVVQYVLHFCSEEAYLDGYIRVSKAYDRVNYEVAAQDIMSNFMNSTKPFLKAPTSKPQCFVIPNWNPMKAIGWMASRSQSSDSKYRGGTFTFFETFRGFNYLSLDNLLDKDNNTPYCRLTIDPMRRDKNNRITYDNRNPDDTLSFEEYNIVKTFDILENMRNGMYANTARIVDVMRPPIDSIYMYHDDFDQGQHLRGWNGMEPGPFSSQEFPPNIYSNAHFKVLSKHKGLFTNEVDGGNQIEEWYAPRQSQLQQIDNYKIIGTLPFHLGLVAGMQVHFIHRDIRDISIRDASEPDFNYSGYYLITDVRRIIQRDKAYLSIQMVKDSLGINDGNSIPA